jgi:hypothetical protein
MPRALRITVLLVALAAMLGVCAVSETPTHFHAGRPAGGCDICFTAHVAINAQSTPLLAITAPGIASGISFAPEHSAYQARYAVATSSRGPPSSIKRG